MIKGVRIHNRLAMALIALFCITQLPPSTVLGQSPTDSSLDAGSSGGPLSGSEGPGTGPVTSTGSTGSTTATVTTPSIVTGPTVTVWPTAEELGRLITTHRCIAIVSGGKIRSILPTAVGNSDKECIQQLLPGNMPNIILAAKIAGANSSVKRIGDIECVSGVLLYTTGQPAPNGYAFAKVKPSLVSVIVNLATAILYNMPNFDTAKGGTSAVTTRICYLA